MSTPTSEHLTSLVFPTAPRRDGRPARDPRLEHGAAAELTLGWMFQGSMGYAGDAKNPRPVRPRSLYDVKRWIADYFPYARFRGAFPETTLYFAFCSDRVKMPLEQAVPLPREDLWWLAAPGDSLLLSDRRTHHYVDVYDVSSGANRIDLLDPWPDRIFLKKGLNTSGVHAVVEPPASVTGGSKASSLRLVSITRDEFLRVVIGVITRDTPELIDDYLIHQPTARGRYETQLAFGLALMDAESDVLTPYAVPRFKAALRLAEAAGRQTDVDYAAARLYVALVSAIRHQSWSGDRHAAKPFEDELRHLTARRSEDSLLAMARSAELCSLGHAAGASKDYAAAQRFLDVAVERFPDEEEPRRLRAKVRVLVGDHQGALEDVTCALAANAERIRAREAERDSRHPHDRHSREDDEARIGGLKDRRWDELDMRTAALIWLERFDEARLAAEELIASAPERSAGYSKLALIEQSIGNETMALARLQEAREREVSPRMRAHMDMMLRGHEGKSDPTTRGKPPANDGEHAYEH